MFQMPVPPHLCQHPPPPGNFLRPSQVKYLGIAPSLCQDPSMPHLLIRMASSWPVGWRVSQFQIPFYYLFSQTTVDTTCFRVGPLRSRCQEGIKHARVFLREEREKKGGAREDCGSPKKTVEHKSRSR